LKSEIFWVMSDNSHYSIVKERLLLSTKRRNFSIQFGRTKMSIDISPPPVNAQVLALTSPALPSASQTRAAPDHKPEAQRPGSLQVPGPDHDRSGKILAQTNCSPTAEVHKR
jgi:hypothetical protein